MKSKSICSVSVSVSLPRELRDRGCRLAFEENRSFSGLIQHLLIEHLRQYDAGRQSFITAKR